MRTLPSLIVACALAVTVSAARADHQRPGIFGDVGAPAVEDPTHGNTTTTLLVRRCNAFITSARLDKERHIRRYRHNYNSGFCIGAINTAMVFMNFRDSAGAQLLGVCLPEGLHSMDVVQTFLDHVKQHPDDRKFNPAFLIYWSLLEKYSCKR